MAVLVNYTDKMPGSILAQGYEKNFLMLFKLEQKQRRLDRKLGSFELEYRWLSQECKHKDDEAYVCVQGQDRILLTNAEAKVILDGLRKNPDSVNLFDHFSLW